MSVLQVAWPVYVPPEGVHAEGGANGQGKALQLDVPPRVVPYFKQSDCGFWKKQLGGASGP